MTNIIILLYIEVERLFVGRIMVLQLGMKAFYDYIYDYTLLKIMHITAHQSWKKM